MKIQLPVVVLTIVLQSHCDAFGVISKPKSCRLPSWCRVEQKVASLQLSSSSPESAESDSAATAALTASEEAAKKEAIGNLVADDEWMGLSMELSELVRVAVVEDLKKNVRDFIGKEDYKVGDVAKKLDSRVKEEVAKIRNKSEYELGDLALAADEIAKNYTEQLTGKPYQPGDLSVEIDKQIKEKIAVFCGKDNYELGDLSLEMDKRVRERVADFTSNESYEFGDVSREIENRRRQWVKDYLKSDTYEFGDITKKAIADLTGKAPGEYQFGDVTKTVLGNLFGPRKRGGSGGDQQK